MREGSDGTGALSGQDAGPRGAPPGAPFGVWLVTDVYPPDCGGSGWSAHALARTLLARGHPVEVIAVDPGNDGLSQRLFEEVRVTELGVRAARRNPFRRLGARDYGHRDLQRYLSDRLAGEKVAIVHAQHLHGGPPALLAARHHGVAAVQTLRDYWPVCLHGTSWWNGRECPGCSPAELTGCMNEYWGWPRPLARAMVPWAGRRLAARRAGMSAARRIITVSDWVRQRIAREAPTASYVVLPNIVDAGEARQAAAAADFEPPVAGPYLLAAGKLLATKGFDIMLEALAEAACGWPIVIAGSGPERARLERQAGELGLEVVFTGWLPHPALLRLITGAAAFLLPAAWNEPLSRLLLESLALGTPVVAWKRGGNPEPLTSGTDSWVVSGTDELRRALRDIQDEAVRARVGAAGQQLAERAFSPAAIYPRLLAVYEQAIAEAGGAKSRAGAPGAGGDVEVSAGDHGAANVRDDEAGSVGGEGHAWSRP